MGKVQVKERLSNRPAVLATESQPETTDEEGGEHYFPNHRKRDGNR